MINEKSLRIGSTRVVQLNDAKGSKNTQLYAKLEYENPTGSHKDRESLALVEHCIKHNYKAIGCASTGNLGISISYLASTFNLKCHVWVTSAISPYRESYLRAFGAEIHKEESNLKEIYKKSSEEMLKRGIYDANPGKNDLKTSANSKIVKEIISSIPEVNSISTCINNGTHLLGLAKGLDEHKIKLNAVYTHNKAAKSISGFTAYEGLKQIKASIRKNNGYLIEAFKEDIQIGYKYALNNGLIIEASSAAVIGTALRMVSPKEVTCLILTGSGLKYPDEIILP